MSLFIDEAITSHFTLGSDIAASGHAIDHFEDGQEWYMSERDCTVLDQTLMMPKFQVGKNLIWLSSYEGQV